MFKALEQLAKKNPRLAREIRDGMPTQEIGVQTSPIPEPKKKYRRIDPNGFKKKISKITDHVTEGKRMGVRFLTVWEGYKFELLERSDFIIERGGESKLKEYLMTLSMAQRDKRRFTALINNQPDLAELLRDDEQPDNL